MNRLAIGALAILAMSGVAGATTVSCAPPNPGVQMNAVGLAAYCGGVSFSNLQVIPFGKNTSGLVYLGSFSVADKWVSLWFDPKLAAAWGVRAQDVSTLFRGDGGVEDDLPVRAEKNAVEPDAACSAVVPEAGRKSNPCPESTLLANIIAARGKQTDEVEQKFEAVKGVWASKDTFTADAGKPWDLHSPIEKSGGSEVPEPAALLLGGPALLGLLLLRRKKRV
jgi:hypothetical protein